MKIILSLLMVVMLGGCMGMPKNMQPVDNFEVNRYLGKWYEIARLDHSFERGLEQVSAEYAMRDDGGIRVVNRGYSIDDQKWEQADGKAYFVETEDIGYLKVSFFGPFYGSYVIFDLDHENYQYSFVSGPNDEYLWLLSRTPTVDQSVIDRFIRLSKSYGFDTDALIFPNQLPNK